MKRFFRWLKAVFNKGMDKLEDPDIMLDQARRDMQEGLIQNREKAVQAISQKNRLQQMYDDTLRKSQSLEGQATMALKQDKRDLARQFIREKASTDQTLATLKSSLDQASLSVDSVKVAIRRQEEEVRKKTAEALAMKAQWKQAQIQNSISKALEGLTFENQFESFGAAAERIKEAQSEASARQEMMSGSLQGQVIQLEDQAMDMEAESELIKLEERLGMRAAPQLAPGQEQQVALGGPADALQLPPAKEVPASEVDQQLAELERRIQEH
jgi:phage shock protein A